MSTVWVAVADYGLNGAGVLDVFDHEPTAEEVALSEHASFGGNRGIEVTQHSVRESHPTTTDDDLPARLESPTCADNSIRSEIIGGKAHSVVLTTDLRRAAARIRDLEAENKRLSWYEENYG